MLNKLLMKLLIDSMMVPQSVPKCEVAPDCIRSSMNLYRIVPHSGGTGAECSMDSTFTNLVKVIPRFSCFCTRRLVMVYFEDLSLYSDCPLITWAPHRLVGMPQKARKKVRKLFGLS
jgi:hypothetical protein